MKILQDYEIISNYTTVYISGYGSFGEGFGDGYGYGDGNGDSDTAFELIHKKYPHNLIIL